MSDAVWKLNTEFNLFYTNQKMMVLLRNVAASRLLRKNLLNIRKANKQNLSLTQNHEIRNIFRNAGKPPNFLYTYRRFCTHLSDIYDENLGEEYLEDLKYDDLDEEETNTERIFEEISAGDPDMLKKLKVLELEVAVLREEECRVPDKLDKSAWQELLELPTLTRRKKFLAFLRLNELKRLNEKKKAENKREFWLKRKAELGPHYYGISGHTMFMRVYDKNVNRLLNLRSFQSKTEIVLDCSYQEFMSRINLRNCAKQIFYCLTEARLHRTPCQVKLFNLNREDSLGKILPAFVKGVYEENQYDIHSESYLEVYPREKLVYLTPHSKTPLKEFNPEDIYIIGAFVDKGTGEKASLAKAKEQKLRMCRFPIDEHMNWKQGSKSLPLNLVLNILLDMVFYRDWYRAFKNLPSRCIQS